MAYTLNPYAPNFSVTNPQTIGPFTSPSLYKLAIDKTSMGAGDILTVSVQNLMVSGGVYKESEPFILSTPVAIPAAPSIGYEPISSNGQEWFDGQYGVQFELTYTAATGNVIPNAGIPVLVTQGF